MQSSILRLSCELQIETSEVREGSYRQRSTSPQQRRASKRDRRPSRHQGPLQSPLPSLSSNTVDILRERGQFADRRAVDSRSSVSRGPMELPLTSLPSNTEDILNARGRSGERSAADSRSDADLARFCNNLYLSRGQR